MMKMSLETLDNVHEFLKTRAVATSLPAGFKQTSNFVAIARAIAKAEKMQAPLALISGSHGVGKTTTLRWYSENWSALMFELEPKTQPKDILRRISSLLSINAGQGYRMQTSVLIDQLKDNPRIIILDEAQRADYDSLDLLKYLADSSGSTFILSASPSMGERIKKWPDIDSRVWIKKRVNPMDAQELVDLYLEDGWLKETLLEIHKCTGGVHREITALFRNCDQLLNGTDLTYSNLLPAHIRAIVNEEMS
ncbi:AAA family ATPase [Deinococcus cellulosilyticus]|uniref:ORC1/DEAH AAA+ ATPase domain-containing protein n=1 Tax=Deinococcus cellulosilyticus (strain DSM 18568 / NBRC 106333 / KACC 11606 / 5516J-15) TaxID=1223518 RepID=A0A511MW40_DEIC1|nr:AAA family ATPase [Deinococcus cellulosilyticus]GEM44792.1 hypothetical protein DC3_04270 [Deinococcus cellulosilyticus NBRC 106333 = KACC 11606]